MSTTLERRTDNAAMTLEELRTAEGVIKRGMQTFREVGQALMDIRERKGYHLAGHATFEDYVKERWGWRRQHAYRLIKASEVAECIPGVTNERTARELGRLKTPDGKPDIEAMKEVIQEIPGASVRELKVVIDKRLHKEKIHALTSSEGVEYYTPSTYIEAAHHVLGGIDLDPASSLRANQTVRAARYFTKEQDGLNHDWPGRVWLNPPYCGLSGPFSEKLVEQYKQGITTAAILLVNANSTDSRWFAPLWDYVLCFTDHRIRFNSESKSGSTFGNAFVYLGPNDHKFAEVFIQFGPIVNRWAA